MSPLRPKARIGSPLVWTLPRLLSGGSIHVLGATLPLSVRPRLQAHWPAPKACQNPASTLLCNLSAHAFFPSRLNCKRCDSLNPPSCHAFFKEFQGTRASFSSRPFIPVMSARALGLLQTLFQVSQIQKWRQRTCGPHGADRKLCCTITKIVLISEVRRQDHSMWRWDGVCERVGWVSEGSWNDQGKRRSVINT